jgi:hypothetical protein
MELSGTRSIWEFYRSKAVPFAIKATRVSSTRSTLATSHNSNVLTVTPGKFGALLPGNAPRNERIRF